MNIVTSVLTLFIWGMVAALIIVLNRIARFYQITSGRRSYYQLFAVPLVLLLAGGLRYATLGIFVGDPWGDSLMLLGGLSLIGLGFFLLRLMTGSRS
jgi:hypothetical protein